MCDGFPAGDLQWEQKVTASIKVHDGIPITHCHITVPMQEAFACYRFITSIYTSGHNIGIISAALHTKTDGCWFPTREALLRPFAPEALISTEVVCSPSDTDTRNTAPICSGDGESGLHLGGHGLRKKTEGSEGF